MNFTAATSVIGPSREKTAVLSSGAAREKIFAALPPFATERVDLDAACGRVLRQAVRAERDQPPFDRVTMDGIAVNARALETGTRQFAIRGTQHAGDPVQRLGDADGCIEVMTGTVLPEGADTVIPVERLQVADEHATLEAGYAADHGQFVHAQGSDHRAGTEVMSPGHRITGIDIAVLASCGLDTVEVASAPTVRVISTGNELVPAGQSIEAQQVRLSNAPAIVAMLAEHAFTDTRADHLPDEREVLETRIASHLEEADVLVLSGGVSMGKADYVPEVLANLGVEQVFHKIAQRPGKPMWFGLGKNGQAVFALPGNPVSALVGCRQYVLPALFHASGRPAQERVYTQLAEPVDFKPPLTCFLPVRVLTDDEGVLLAIPVPTNTSGDFTALSGTDGYVELDATTDHFAAGLPVPFHAWNAP